MQLENQESPPQNSTTNSVSAAAGTNLRRWGLVLLWMLLLAGVLRSDPLLQKVIGANNSICGVWGCGPPINSILVWQGFIALAIVPTAVIAAKKFPITARRWGRVVLAVTLAGAAIFLLVNTVQWYQSTSAFAREFLVRRVLFAMVSFTDAPVIPAVLAATVYWWLSRSQMQSNQSRMTTCDPSPNS